ncbi:inner membrane protein [alpha proteobacterium U9-1i]|nr:inner membrane protein [alpha proteobacterium U9-1i]
MTMAFALRQCAWLGVRMNHAEDRDRIPSLDVIRGFAVLGILIVNAAYFAAPWQTAINPALPPLAVTDDTLWAWLAMHVFFEAKCITLFSLLFGASIYLVGGERDDDVRGRVLRRRLLWMVLFGLIHGALIWSGDILLTYALAGLLVSFARSWPPRQLMVSGLSIYAITFLLDALGGASLSGLGGDDLREIIESYWSPPPEELARAIVAYQAGALSALRENFSTWIDFVSFGLVGLIAQTGALMLIGLALFKWGFLSGRAPIWLYVLMLVLGAAAFAIIAAQALASYAHGFDFTYMHAIGQRANDLAIFGSLFYASLFILLVKTGARFITAPLAAVGRMAFTNYIAQSLIMTTIFYGGRGFALFGEVDRPGLWAIVAAIWAVQLVWSPLWLARFKMGPLEWVWRRLSYGAPLTINRGRNA